MKKILINLIIILMTFVAPIKAIVVPKEKIDLNKNSSLTLEYNYNNLKFDNLEIKLYRVATIDSKLNYKFTPNFASLSVKINGLKTDNEYDILKETLENYIVANNINPDGTYYLKNNLVNIKDLTPGLYLVRSSKVDTDEYTLNFNSFLVNAPTVTEDGKWSYDIIAYPKGTIYTPKEAYSVVKEWKDNGEDRPQSVEVEIYKDDELFEKVTLSRDNNWTYKWTSDGKSEWNVVERNVPSKYIVSITLKDTTFVIVNTRFDNPSTGDNIMVYFCVGIVSILGITLSGLYLLNKRKDN